MKLLNGLRALHRDDWLTLGLIACPAFITLAFGLILGTVLSGGGWVLLAAAVLFVGGMGLGAYCADQMQVNAPERGEGSD